MSLVHSLLYFVNIKLILYLLKEEKSLVHSLLRWSWQYWYFVKVWFIIYYDNLDNIDIL